MAKYTCKTLSVVWTCWGFVFTLFHIELGDRSRSPLVGPEKVFLNNTFSFKPVAVKTALYWEVYGLAAIKKH